MRDQRQGSEWILSCQELEAKVRMHQGSMLSSFLFELVVDDVTDFDREHVLSELLYADDLVLISETMRNGLKVNLLKKRAMVSSSIIKNCLSKNKVDPCGVCSLRVKANSALCA